MKNYLLNAGWELKNNKAICRWFISWKDLGENQIAGAIAGYLGGGSFMVERFYATYTLEGISALWIDFTDLVSNSEIEFSTLGNDILTATADAEDEIWNWNIEDAWLDEEELIIDQDKLQELNSEGDMAYLNTGSMPYLRQICELAGLTAILYLKYF
jgi:hypothetical protein